MVLVVLLAAASGGSALAQGYPPPGPYGPPPGPFDPYNAPPARGGEVDDEAATRMLAARGFTNISVIRRRGPTLLMEANGPRGERVQLIVDAMSGAINGMKVIGFGDKRY
ncbi:hypothetical protein [Ancylobacter sp. SL191]|uniref:hypothetical protein n=1 Tax=Ancylobacter sp. SL191 TaxID=2995166 RepID=UPI00226EC540|nr:hypothetical protein [Ancylobacter sp. SL191]WAC29187.1 hypothetical protein OU996_09250 [Ancylobacter sp. SL191]